jgi:hypothetical protein
LQTAIRLDSWVSFSEDVRRLGITHVLVADEQFCKGRLGMTFTASENEFPFARQLVEKYGEKVAQFGHFQLYRLWTQSLDDAIANGQDAQRPGFALDRAGAAEAH